MGWGGVGMGEWARGPFSFFTCDASLVHPGKIIQLCCYIDLGENGIKKSSETSLQRQHLFPNILTLN